MAKLSNRGKAQRDRGIRCERKYAKELAIYGFKRVPLSGAAGRFSPGWSGDLARGSGIIQRIEVKHRKSAFKSLRNWLAEGDADALLIDTGGQDPALIVMDEDVFRRYLDLELPDLVSREAGGQP